MIPELGHFALILSFCFFLVLAIVPLIGASTANDSLNELRTSFNLGNVFVP